MPINILLLNCQVARENLVSAEIVIADLSGRNANVFYELGVRHAVGNNCILIADSLEDVPFDLRPLRTIVYQYEPSSMIALKNSLELAIREILTDPNGIDNPVRRYLYNKELSDAIKSPSPESDLIKTVVSEMASLRNQFEAQSSDIRRIMNLITSKPTADQNPIDIGRLQGVWEDKHILSTFYIRVVNGELYAAYTYGEFTQLTGHVYNWKIIDNSIFGRFEWFNLEFSGYIYLRIENDNLMVGGWWDQQDIPQEISNDISKVNDSLPGMYRLYIEKESDSLDFPPFVEDYFYKRKLL